MHQGLDVALYEASSSKKPRNVIDEESFDVLDKAHNVLILSLGDSILREVGSEKTTARL